MHYYLTFTATLSKVILDEFNLFTSLPITSQIDQHRDPIHHVVAPFSGWLT